MPTKNKRQHSFKVQIDGVDDTGSQDEDDDIASGEPGRVVLTEILQF